MYSRVAGLDAYAKGPELVKHTRDPGTALKYGRFGIKHDAAWRVSIVVQVVILSLSKDLKYHVFHLKQRVIRKAAIEDVASAGCFPTLQGSSSSKSFFSTSYLSSIFFFSGSIELRSESTALAISLSDSSIKDTRLKWLRKHTSFLSLT
jgi:hypothetical protein